MSTRASLRRADPARRLPDLALEERDEQLLRQILAIPSTAATAPPRRQPRPDRRPVLVTGVVAVVVVAGTVAAIQAARTVPPPPAASTGPTASVDAALIVAVDARLDQVATGEEAGLDQPSMTWTQAQQGAQGGPIDLTDKTLYAAAACEGGGAIAIRITGRPDTTVDCTRFTTVGPIDLTALLKKQTNGIGFDVVTTSGHPRYLVKQVAYPTDSVGTDARGQTYGPWTGEARPDLIAAIATNGRTGYISAKEEDAATPCGHPKNPADAVRCAQEHGSDVVPIPVYESDGTTVIGTFEIGS